MSLLDQIDGGELFSQDISLSVKKDTRPSVLRNFDERVEMLVRYGNTFESHDPTIALEHALSHSANGGFVATLPELLAGCVRTQEQLSWKDYRTGHTEENAGIDRYGRFYKRGEAVAVVVHGGGLLTPARLRQAIVEGLSDGAVIYTKNEFDGLLEGRLSDGTQIPLYTLEHIRAGLTEFPHQFGVVMPYTMARDTRSGFHTKDAFISNSFVLARTAGAHEYLNVYFENVCGQKKTVGCWHPYRGNPPRTPFGRLTCLDKVDNGNGGDLNIDNYGFVGRFVGVQRSEAACTRSSSSFVRGAP